MSRAPRARDDDLYPIRTVCRMTGVHPVTLRAWERRYALVRPGRTAKGHRLYTDADVARIRRVLALLEDGVPVSRVRPLLDQAMPSTSTHANVDRGDAFGDYARRMLEAVNDFDEAALDAIYNDAMSLYPLALVSERAIRPVLRALGEGWRDGEAGIAREHFFSTFVRNKIGARFNHVNRISAGHRVLACCPAGERHELGLMHFALTAAEAGYRMVLLGTNLPAREITSAARAARCAAVVLSVSINRRAPALDKLLTALVSSTPLPVLVGGDGAVKARRTVEAAGAIVAGADFADALYILDRTLRRR